MRVGFALENTISLVIVDEDAGLLDRFCRTVGAHPDYALLGSADCASRAYGLIRCTCPDVIALHLKLPAVAGLRLLRQLQNAKFGQKPGIIVYSQTAHEATIRQAVACGADYYMLLPFETEALLERIGMVCGYAAYAAAGIAAAPVLAETDGCVESRVNKALLKAGIPPNTLGYRYLKDGVMYLRKSRGDGEAAPFGIYHVLSGQYQTRPCCVERAIYYAKSVAFSRNGKCAHEGPSGKHRDIPTNYELIREILHQIGG